MSSQTPEEIEREIERERAELAVNINQLQESLSLDALMERTTTYAKTHARDIGQAVVAQARTNPIPVALIGAGLAWLAFGGNKARVVHHEARVAKPAYEPVESRPAYAPVDRTPTRDADYRTVPADAAAQTVNRGHEPDWLDDDDTDAGQPQWVRDDDVWKQPGDRA